MCLCECAPNEIHLQCTWNLDSHQRTNYEQNRNSTPYDNGIEDSGFRSKRFQKYLFNLCNELEQREYVEK